MLEPGQAVALEKWPGWPASALHAGGYAMVVKNDAVDVWRRAIHHRRVANAYEQALVRPWVWVDCEFSTPSLPDAPVQPPNGSFAVDIDWAFDSYTAICGVE
jgi:hypothetical protein